MKKILVALFLLLSLSNAVYAAKDNTIKFNGKKYTLLYSIKSPEHNGYLNEYYKIGESYNTWSELLAMHHFPNVYSPIDQATAFAEYIEAGGCPVAISIDEKNNSGIMDFILIYNKKLPIILEFNIFKYKKSKDCGTVAVQYAKRYAVTNSMQADEVKREFEKYRKKMLKKVNKFDIPSIISEPYDMGVRVVESEKLQKNDVKVEENKIVENENENLVNDVENTNQDVTSDDASRDKEQNIEEILPDIVSEQQDSIVDNIEQKDVEIVIIPNYIPMIDDKIVANIEESDIIPAIVYKKDKKNKEQKEQEKNVIIEKNLKEQTVSTKHNKNTEVKAKEVKQNSIKEKSEKKVVEKQKKSSIKEVKNSPVSEKQVRTKIDKKQAKKQRDIEKLEKDLIKLHQSLEEVRLELDNIKSK